tara:strand:- start:121 stop:507 length:387 start_codon:yes stop_codon:yes gene_type:complete
MYNFFKLLSILEAVYIIYMFNYFKTTKFFHHPLEIIIQRKSYITWLQHPIGDDEYNNKICPFGNFMGYILAIWILFVYFNPTSFVLKCNNIIWILTFIISLITNFNAFIYIIPCLLIEKFKFKFSNSI